MVLSLKEIEKSFGDHTVLKNISLQINENDRIGMIGTNGSGKSTLLNIIAGVLSPDGGEVIFGKDVSVGYLRQNTPLSGGSTVWQEMRSVFSDILQLETEIRNCQNEISVADASALPQLNQKLQTLTERFEAADGYQIDVKIAQVLTGLGFPKPRWDKIVDHLSGGERVRLSLARLLLTAPSLLMLDEPTNHLDFATLSFLEEYIKNYKGTVLMVSHDRYFLDKTVSQIWEAEQPYITAYPGNYSKFKVLKAERRAALQKEYDKAMIRKAELEDYIARNLVRASTSAMAKSRQKELDRLTIPILPPAESHGMQFCFVPHHKSGMDVLVTEHLSASIEERQLFKNIDLDIKRGEKIALVGQNGIGKTTLFRCLLQQADKTEGIVRWGKGVSIGYFDQHGESLTASLSPFGQIAECFPADTDGQKRDLLAKVSLKGEAVFAPISTLSGGQKAGVSFALLMRRQDNVLLLDEPTNHLDLQSRENLESALAAFEGTLLMISHDRYLLSTVPTVIYELTETGLKRYENFSFYESSYVVPVKETTTKKSESAPDYHKDKKERARLAAKRNRLSAIEKEIEALETENITIEQTLAEGNEDYQKLQTLCEQLSKNKQKISDLTDEWLILQE